MVNQAKEPFDGVDELGARGGLFGEISEHRGLLSALRSPLGGPVGDGPGWPVGLVPENEPDDGPTEFPFAEAKDRGRPRTVPQASRVLAPNSTWYNLSWLYSESTC